MTISGEEKNILKKIISKNIAKKTKFVPGKSQVKVGWPIFGEEEILSVFSSMLELRISQGEKVKEFESMYAAEIGVKNAIAVNSGSSANLLAIDALLQKGMIKKGSEVIVPAATFATVASPIIQLGLVPVFVDVESDSYNISPEEIESAINKNTSMIMVVHSLGNPAKMDKITKIAKKNSVILFEDCCESHHASISGKIVGSFGDISTLSFFVAHNITTGEGGMIFSNDSELAEICRSLREFGRRLNQSPRFQYVNNQLGEYDVRYIFDRLGYNFRMTDIEASIGIEQLKKLPEFNKARIENAKFFYDSLGSLDSLQLPNVEKNSVHTFYGFPIMVKEKAAYSRRQIVDFLEKSNIETRPFMGGNLAVQPAFAGKKIKVHGDLKNSKLISRNMFFIGCHPGIGEEEREYVVDKIKEFDSKNK